MAVTLHSLPACFKEVNAPEQFTFPFCYEPHPLCVAAANEVQAYVNQQKHVYQLLALQYIAVNHLLQLLHLFFRALGKTIAGQIYQVPLVINNKVVNEQCFTGCGTGLSQIFLAGKHVYQARLTHVRTTNKGVFGFGILRTHRLHRSA